MNSWLTRQSQINTKQWDESLITFYPEAVKWMSDPVLYLNRLTVECNYLAAAKLIDWNKFLVPNSRVLDVGCGGGWLTAYLSQNKMVKNIIAIDSSENYLEKFLPNVVSQLKGDYSKIETVQGLFTPIMLEDESVDLIVISSAVHHAESMNAILVEFKRVLKTGGILIILNENPISSFSYLYKISKAFANTFVKTFVQKYNPYVQKISSGGLLYDPYLGDVVYPEWYWRKAISASGLKLIQFIDSELAPLAITPVTKGNSLKHFVCQK
jgi:ubiquinone/menaquinone biosynthesis C-methylase UbiE